MEIKEAKKIIQAGFAWENWTDEQKQAFKLAYEAIDKAERYEKALKEIERWDKMLYSARELGNFAKKALGIPIFPLKD